MIRHSIENGSPRPSPIFFNRVRVQFLVRAPDSINGDGSAPAAARGAAILDSDNFAMTQATYVCYSLKFR